jgi:hypothetical protein
MVYPVLVEQRNYFIQKLVRDVSRRSQAISRQSSIYAFAIASGLLARSVGNDETLQILWNVAQGGNEKDSVTQQYPFFTGRLLDLAFDKSEQEGPQRRLAAHYDLQWCAWILSYCRELSERDGSASDWLDFDNNARNVTSKA